MSQDIKVSVAVGRKPLPSSLGLLAELSALSLWGGAPACLLAATGGPPSASQSHVHSLLYSLLPLQSQQQWVEALSRHESVLPLPANFSLTLLPFLWLWWTYQNNPGQSPYFKLSWLTLEGHPSSTKSLLPYVIHKFMGYGEHIVDIFQGPLLYKPRHSLNIFKKWRIHLRADTNNTVPSMQQYAWRRNLMDKDLCGHWREEENSLHSHSAPGLELGALPWESLSSRLCEAGPCALCSNEDTELRYASSRPSGSKSTRFFSYAECPLA